MRRIVHLRAWVLVVMAAATGAATAAPPAPSGGGLWRVAAPIRVQAAVETPTEQREADAPLTPAPEKTADTPAEADATALVGWLELSGPLPDRPAPFAWAAEQEATLSTVLDQLETVATNDDYLGMVIYLDWPELGLSQIHAIRKGIEEIRADGKRVLVFAEAYDLMGYLLASSADLILLQHKGDVDLTGIGMEEMYLAGLLEKIGAKADLLQIGQYKGADETFARTGPSEAWNQNISALLDDLYAQVVDAIAEGRGLDRADVEAMMRDSWQMRDTDYLKRRVVDRLVDRDLISVTEIEFGDDFVWDDSMGRVERAAPQMDNPFALFKVLFQAPATRPVRPSIAVIHAVGPITSGDSSYGDGLFGSESIGSRTLVEILGDARDDEQIKAVLLQLDSPGGSALASEVIWQAVREVAETKPVYASVGSMAASGGYYLACAADQVYVMPGSILGSIGVVGGKIVLGGTYQKLGINVTRRSRGPFGDMFNSVEPFTQEQRQAVRASMERVYDQFLERVSIGRGSRLPDAAKVAEGRLFTGRQAVENGLADRIGTVDDALAALAAEAGLQEGGYDVIHYPEPMSFAEFLEGVFGNGVRGNVPSVQQGPASGIAAAARELLGEPAWNSVRGVLAGMMELRREPVLVILPTAIVVR